MGKSRPRVFVSRRIPPRSLAMLEAECEVHVWEEDVPPPRPKLLDELALADGILCMLTEDIDKDALIAAPKLRAISNYAVGYDNIDIDAATEREIPVGHTPGVLTESCADHAFLLMMAAARRLPESMAFVKNGEWQAWNAMQLLGQDVYGSTLGIVGFGRIGQAVAKRASGFDMRVIYNRGDDRAAEKLGAEKVSLEVLLQESDFVSLHVPLTEETRHLIGGDALAQMKDTAILVNTARGEVVDTAALVEALDAGSIGGAALDVTDPEPLPADHVLLSFDHCIVVPHVASATLATRERIGKIAVENLLLGLRGERMLHTVNHEVYRRR